MSVKPDDSPLAFPRSDGGYSQTLDGMSLRDYFAAKAMAAYLTSPATAKEATDNPHKCAEWAYMQANAMLAERNAA